VFFLSGSFVDYTAGVLNAYEGVILFVALTDNYILKTLLQQYKDYVPEFNINGFEFKLIGIRAGYDVFRYILHGLENAVSTDRL
jgi:hypothetical protein